MNSQSAKTTESAKEREYNEKKTKGRKRHIAVDTMGNLLSVVVLTANFSDTKTEIHIVREVYKRYPGVKGFCADAGYRGTFVLQVE